MSNSIQVAYEGNIIVLVRDSRSSDSMLSVSEAYRLVMALRFTAEQASKCPEGARKGEIWNCKVQSYDGFVAIRFRELLLLKPPTRVHLPVRAALQLADTIEFSAQQATYKMRFEFVR